MTPLGKRGSSIYINSPDWREEVRGFPREAEQWLWKLRAGPSTWPMWVLGQYCGTNWTGLNDFCCGRPSSLLERGHRFDADCSSVCVGLTLAEAGLLGESKKDCGSPLCLLREPCLPTPLTVPCNVPGKRRREAFAFSRGSEYRGKVVSEYLLPLSPTRRLLGVALAS